MNKERRKKLEIAIDKLGEALELLEECQAEEEEAAENISDYPLYASRLAEELSQNAETISDECFNLDSTISTLQELLEI